MAGIVEHLKKGMPRVQYRLLWLDYPFGVATYFALTLLGRFNNRPQH